MCTAGKGQHGTEGDHGDEKRLSTQWMLLADDERGAVARLNHTARAAAALKYDGWADSRRRVWPLGAGV